MYREHVIWNENGVAETDGWAMTYCVDPATREYVSRRDIQVAIGDRLPADAYLDEPPAGAAGKAIVRAADGWALIDDYRWLPVYNKQTRQRVGINVPGALPAELTLLAPTSQYDEWNDELGAWVENRDLKLQLAKSSLLAEIAAKRWQVEIGGISVAGIPIATEREDQAMLNSVYVALKGELIPSTPWKAADGSFTLVTLPMLEPIVQAVAAHVQACFAAEQEHCEAIAHLATQAELEAYDINAGWPTNRD